jgi:hypothetical protein
MRASLLPSEPKPIPSPAIAVEFYTPPPESATQKAPPSSANSNANIAVASPNLPEMRSTASPPNQPANPASSTVLAPTSDLKVANQPRNSAKTTKTQRSQTTPTAATTPSQPNQPDASSPNTTAPNPQKQPQSTIALTPPPAAPNPEDNNPGEDESWKKPVVPFVATLPTPTEFLAQIKPASTPVQSSDLPIENELEEPFTHPPTIKGKAEKTLASNPASCLLSAGAVPSFGKTVVLKVAIDDTGKPINQNSISVQKTSGNESYDKLAICSLKTWSFNPAYDVNTTSQTRLYRPSFLDIEITIRQS